MMTPEQQEAWELFQELGTKQAVADRLGKARSTVSILIKRAQKWLDVPDGVKSSLENTGVSAEYAHSGWRTEFNDDGEKIGNVYYQLPKEDATRQTFEEYVEQVKEAFVDVGKSKPRKAEPLVDADLLTRYLLTDLHFGMMAWGRESGADYDLKIAIERLHDAMNMLVESAPSADTGLICNLGDMFHANDQKNMTPGHGHILDMDGRFAKIAIETTKAIIHCIEKAKHKHRRVKYVAVNGNHDPDQNHWLTIALMMRYENDPAVDIVWNPAKLYARQFGRNLLCLHHGDRVKPERLALQIADTHAELWGRTDWRYLDTGHIHHDSGKEIGGISWESHRTLAAKDAYAAGGGYVARQTMKAITVHRERGEVVRNTVGVR